MTRQGKWHHFRTCTTTLTPFVQWIGPNTFYNLYYWTRALGFIIVPSCLLIVLNALLIRGIRRAELRKQRLLRYLPGAEPIICTFYSIVGANIWWSESKKLDPIFTRSTVVSVAIL